MKKLLALLLLFGIVGCSNDKAPVNASSYSMILTCKMNPSALYSDKFYFNLKMTSVNRTSNNKAWPPETYKIEKMSSTEYKLEGVRTGALFIIKDEGSRFWGLYYDVDYDTDPFRFMSCRKS